MKRFIRVLGALLVIHLAAIPELTTPAFATPIGNPFGRGYTSPGQLADAIAASLAKDPSGKTYVNADRCAQDGSCATPDDYFVTFRKDDPHSKLASVADLPAYLRTLVSVQAPAGKYWMACLKFTSKTPGKHWQPISDCLARAFKPGEHAWMDPVTKRIVLAEDCTNPVDKPEVSEKCAYINFYAKVKEEGDTSARIKEYGPTDLADETICTPALKRAGEQNWEYPWMDECPSAWCNFEAIDAQVPEKGGRTSSFRLTTSGMYTLRLPLKVAEELSAETAGLRAHGKKHSYRVVFCIERTTDPGPSLREYKDLVAEGNRLQGEADANGIPTAFGRLMTPEMYNQHALADGIDDSPQAQAINRQIRAHDAKADQWNAQATSWNALHSCGMGVKWFDYLPQPDGSKAATIYYSEADAQQANAKDALGRDTLLWWRFDRTLCP